MKNKIFTLENLKKIISEKKNKKKKIVLCHGVFDLLHVGHIKHFNEAKKMGDILIVTVTPDIYVNKGPGRPAFNEKLRILALSSLESIDYVSLNPNPTAVNPIKILKPDIYCKGPDYKKKENDTTGQIKEEIRALKKIRGRIIYTKSSTFSSSKLINIFDDYQNEKLKLLIKKIKKEYSISKIKKLFENFKKTKVLIIGETIIDQYVFCEALGKSGKEPVLVLRDLSSEEYLGGAAALSRHLGPFCDQVSLLTMLGEKAEYLKKIKKEIPKNVKLQFIRKKNSPTILKRRFLDDTSKNKVLGVYKINDDMLNKTQDKKFYSMLKNILPKYDLVIVSDYGHGLISKRSANLISKKSKFLALNAQVNAANIGYHSMRNYERANCVIINNREVQYEMRDRGNSEEFLMKKLASKQNIQDIVVTRGEQGALLYNKKHNKFYYSQAFANYVLDKVGAGDAMLSLLALCLKNKLSRELSLMLGSLAAAQSVETVGNKDSVNKIKIIKTLEHLLR